MFELTFYCVERSHITNDGMTGPIISQFKNVIKMGNFSSSLVF